MKAHGMTGKQNAKKPPEKKARAVGIRLSGEHIELLASMDKNGSHGAMVKKIVLDFLNKYQKTFDTMN
jgi:hypothetical protein